jgi:hypothetical protein
MAMDEMGLRHLLNELLTHIETSEFYWQIPRDLLVQLRTESRTPKCMGRPVIDVPTGDKV